MGLGEKSFTVGEESYTVSKWSGDKGFVMLIRLGQAVGDALKELIRAYVDMQDEETVDKAEAAAVGAIMTLFASLNPKDALQLVKDILEETKPEGAGSLPVTRDFAARFAGAQLHMLRLVFEVVKYQYEDFTGAFSAKVIAGLAGARAGKASKSPST